MTGEHVVTVLPAVNAVSVASVGPFCMASPNGPWPLPIQTSSSGHTPHLGPAQGIPWPNWAARAPTQRSLPLPHLPGGMDDPNPARANPWPTHRASCSQAGHVCPLSVLHPVTLIMTVMSGDFSGAIFSQCLPI